MRRRWKRLGIVAGLLALGWVLFAQLDTWRTRGELRLAQQEIEHGRLEAARRRLTALAARSGALGGAAHYLLGVCEALGGRPDAALRAFARLPEGYAFDAVGAYHEAKANLSQGRLRAAERRLEWALAQDGPGRDRVRDLLSHIYQIEVRFDDVKPLLRASLAAASDPIRDLKELSNFDVEGLPYDGLKATLEKAGQLAPTDDRVWLGKARLAIEDGRWDDAENWLRRCRDAGADAPVWRAWLDWARGSGRPDEAIEAARHLGSGPGQLEPGERLALSAWLNQQRGDPSGEAQALEEWLRIEPAATPALERLAELAHRSGQPGRVTELRHRKAEVERAREAYRLRLWHHELPRTAAERSELARQAEAAGRRHEARALYAWALQADPADSGAQAGLARLDRADADCRLALSADAEPWPDPGAVARLAPASRGTGHVGELAFTDDAESVGLRFVYDNPETPIHQMPEIFGGGLALLDYNGDGWLDVYCVQGGPFATSPGTAFQAVGADDGRDARATSGDRLFHNRGNGTFEDVTDRSGIGRFPRGHGHGVAVGDVDGDGHSDLFVTRWRSYALYRNKGDGTFEDMTTRAGLGGDRDWPTSAALVDLDGDGDLDLYVCHYAAWDVDNPRICRDPNTRAYRNCNPLDTEALPDHLFRNDGGRFVEVTEAARINDRNGRGLGVVAADLDDDGRMDLFVANDASANFLFRNLGGMRFEEVGHEAGVAGNASGGYQAGMGVAAGDLDGDGLIDLAVTNFYGESTTFYRKLGSGAFTDATAAVGLAVASRRLLGFGVGLLDADNDGLLDLASANGHVNDLRPNYPYQMPAQLLVGGADGRLADVSDRAGAPWQVPRMGRGLAVGDLDNDGREDVLILSHNQPLAYLHNRTEGGHWLTLRLEGRKSNRDAVGAKVAIIAGGRRRLAWRVGGGSYQSACDPRIHFGLGTADRIEAVEVTWPSGRVDRYLGLQLNSGYLFREGEHEPRPLEGFQNIARRG
jgi:tetratricopeptide (TPR) repeat protein